MPVRLDEATRLKIKEAYTKYRTDHPDAGPFEAAKAVNQEIKVSIPTILRWGDPQEAEKMKAKRNGAQKPKAKRQKPSAAEPVETYVANSGNCVTVAVREGEQSTEFQFMGANYKDVVDGLRKWAASTHRKV